jgi:hypothetical protein
MTCIDHGRIKREEPVAVDAGVTDYASRELLECSSESKLTHIMWFCQCIGVGPLPFPIDRISKKTVGAQ